MAWLAASSEDWLIPSGLLNSTVSGLISRSLYTEPQSGLHRSVFYEELRAADHSLAFIEQIDRARQTLQRPMQCLPMHQQPSYRTAGLIDSIAADYHITNRNRIKPTIAELPERYYAETLSVSYWPAPIIPIRYYYDIYVTSEISISVY